MTHLNASIVLYCNEPRQVSKAIRSIFESSITVKLILVDNSPTDDLRSLQDISDNIEYIFNKKNLGYGSAHNIAIKKSVSSEIPYHLVLNPDVHFDAGVLERLYNFMQANTDIGHVMPKILYPDGEVQHLCKLLPSPTDLILRRFVPFSRWRQKHSDRYELRLAGYEKTMDVPSLSGCFMFLRTSVLAEVGFFDERYFMYLEDHDLTRRIGEVSRTVYYPEVFITHEYAKGSYKNKKLLKYHIKSAIAYFNKWGWILDYKRREVNRKTLKIIKTCNS